MQEATNKLLSVIDQHGVVKICGLRQLDHAVVAAEAGAVLLGLMFAQSRRQIDADDAAVLVRDLRVALGAEMPLIVGVFVDEHPARINEIVDRVGLDAVQLHGYLPADELRRIRRPVIRVTNPEPGRDVASVFWEMLDLSADAFLPVCWLVDAWDPVQQGGTGKRADWRLAQELAKETSFFLAGGLNAANVAEAITLIDPLGVDVSSGVETDGVKDPAKIEEFVRVAREAFRSIQR